jgi:peptidoglycan/xylan/chitin deacetylase (PgdA/CDA1 family)
LPGSYDALPDYPKSRAMAAIVAALKAHQIAPVGFVNGIYADADADAQAGLMTWIDTGFELGNHTYSHQSARALSVSAFLEDVRKNRAFIGHLAPERTLRFFRFPYLERGNSPSERIAITQGLARDGYRVANVSIDFGDWAYAPAFARCRARADANALRALSESYLQSASAALFWAAESSAQLFARALPQVLLIHAHAATAENLPALLAAYEQAGVTWITLEEALRDAAYVEPADRDHGDTALISEAIRTSGAALKSFVPRALPLLDLACR